jgi:hypothetical protein
LRPTAERGELTGYSAALDELWHGVAPTMSELECVAAEPRELLEDAELDRLRYSLHRAAELVHGLAPPPGAGRSHAELAEALCCAREATGVIADALEDGGLAAAEPLVWEWRGALFSVRLARHRQGDAQAVEVTPPGAGPRRVHAPLTAAVLVLGGASLVLGGAIAGLWPLWSLGTVLILASLPVSPTLP